MGAGARAVPDLSAWPGAEVLTALDGGARAVVHLVRRGDRLLVAKASTRSAPSLDWELDLLTALHAAGLAVPTAVPTADGRRHDGGVFLQPFLTGGPPRGQRDWRAVAAVVATAHEVTRGWPQRPGSAGAAQLLRTDRGGDVDLSALPPGAAALVRACWRALLDDVARVGAPAEQCVVHGDLGAGAVLLDAGRVGLIDWDEARTDVAAFDLAALLRASDVPDDADARVVGIPAGADRDVWRAAALAWETATCWVAEPPYARRCLQQLRRSVAAG